MHYYLRTEGVKIRYLWAVEKSHIANENEQANKQTYK